jgi:uncharacterized membrane protein
MKDQREPGSLAAPGILLGLGLGGFVDGIVLHQILQWHHMLTSTEQYSAVTVEALKVNSAADGFFHAATWIFTVVGLVLLWRATRGRRAWTGRGLTGLILAGWGLFNLVEGVVDHHLLQIHHVRSGANELLYDLGFLALGAALLIGGLLMYRRDRQVVDITEPARATGARARV